MIAETLIIHIMLLVKFLLCALLITLVGCAPETVDNLKSKIEPNSDAVVDNDTYLTCSNYRIEREDEGYVVFDETGLEVTRHDGKHMWRKIGPNTTNGRKPNCSDIISISNNGRYGYLMPNGRLFANQLFENTSGLTKKVLSFSRDKRWGLIDINGRIIVQPIYDEITWYRRGKYAVKHENDIFLMDESGQRSKIEDDPDYSVEYKTKLAPREAYLSCAEGIKRKSMDGKWGLIDANDTVIIPFEFRAISCFYPNDRAYVPVDKMKAWCPIDMLGQIDDTLDCITSHYPFWPSHYWHEKLHNNEYESSVLWTKAYLDYGEGRIKEPPRFFGGRAGLTRKTILASPSYSDLY